MDDFDKAFEEMAGPATEPQESQEEPQVAMADAELPEPPPEAEQPAEAAPAEQPAEPPAPATLEELFALIPQDKVERYQGVVQQVRSDLGRVAALNRLYADQKAAADEAARRFEEAQTQLKELQERAAATDKTKEEVKEIQEGADDLEQQFPELAKAVKLTVKNLIRQELPAKAAESQAPQAQAVPEQEKPSEDGAVEAMASEFAALQAAHPDWQDARNRPEFKPWLQAQPQSMQRLVASNKAQDAILLIDSFKRDLRAAGIRAEAERQAANRKRLEQHVAVKGAQPRITSAPNDFEAAFNYFAQQG